MIYKSFEQQVEEHRQHLTDNLIEVIDFDPLFPKWVKCKELGSLSKKMAYKVHINLLRNGLVGIVTLYGQAGGDMKKFSTYGLPPSGEVTLPESKPKVECEKDENYRRAWGFWQRCSTTGESEYLKKKEVSVPEGCGVRYRDTDLYGSVLVIPVMDEKGHLFNCQMISASGTKRFIKGCRVAGGFFMLRPIVDIEAIAICEGFATACTLASLIKHLPIACCFSSLNIVPVVKKLKATYRDFLIYLFTDNDRHLTKNTGVSKAEEAKSVDPEKIHLLTPEFGSTPPGKDATDWNDLVRLLGKQEAIRQLQKPHSFDLCEAVL